MVFVNRGWYITLLVKQAQTEIIHKVQHVPAKTAFKPQVHGIQEGCRALSQGPIDHPVIIPIRVNPQMPHDWKSSQRVELDPTLLQRYRTKMLPERLQQFFDTPIPVLGGHLQLVDVMGDDQAVVNAARVSYGAGTKRVSEDRHLLRYLMRHNHTSPFEMCELKIRIKIPNDAWKHVLRHRTANVNETSTRYSDTSETDYYEAIEWRAQSTDNKQGSKGLVETFPEGWSAPYLMGPPCYTAEELASPGAWLSARERDLHRQMRDTYKERMEFGVARELARKDLPFGFYAEAYWKMDARNLLHFLQLRLDEHAQWEVRQFAQALSEVVKVWMPWTWEAFNDYVLEAVTLSRQEAAGLRDLLQVIIDWSPGWSGEKVIKTATQDLTGREKQEFAAKLKKLVGLV